jgi:hypothetical protein
VEQAYELRKVPVISIAKVAFVILLVVGILIAIIYSIIFSSMSFLAGALGDSPLGDDFAIFRNFGLIMIPVIALSYAIFGTIGVIIWTLVYNLVASVTGGIELILKQKGQQQGAGGGTPPGWEKPHAPEGPINGF